MPALSAGFILYLLAGAGLMRRAAWGWWLHTAGAVGAAFTGVGVAYTVPALAFALRPSFRAPFFGRAAPAPRLGEPPHAPPAIMETVLYAEDLDAGERFYTIVLGLQVTARRPGRHVFFRCGGAMFLLFDPEATMREGASAGSTPIPRHGARGPGHAAFSIPADEIDAWRRHLAAHGVAVEADVAWPGGGRSIYVRDPAGNSIELVTPETWGLGAPARRSGRVKRGKLDLMKEAPS